MVLYLEKTKTTQALDITSLKMRVKKLEKKQRSRTHKLKRLYEVGLTARVEFSEDEQSLGKDTSKQERKIDDIDQDDDITLFNDQDDAKMFDVNDLHGEDVFVKKEVADKEVNAAGEVNAASIATTDGAAATITAEEITLAQALVEIKKKKPKAKRILLQEPNFRTDFVEGSSKRAGEELTQESAKKQKVEDDKEIAELKQLMEIIPGEEEVAVDAISLTVKSPRIVD
uniref:Uncharacterized protein n=1 Tax=Tanacetum cinerariifolium TaxID=118510 RepID=A0A699HK96_TANCI|nr:hypothetical protein [Tanacetum cinerariifolium]